ncbi:MAG: hypothetical protein ACLVB8_00205 [Bacteroides thetaiotaomicron]
MELEELIENTLRRKHLEEMMNRPEKEHTPLEGMDNEQIKRFALFLFEENQSKSKQLDEMIARLDAIGKDLKESNKKIDSLTNALLKANSKADKVVLEYKLRDKEYKKLEKKYNALLERLSIMNTQTYASSKSLKGIDRKRVVKGSMMTRMILTVLLLLHQARSTAGLFRIMRHAGYSEGFPFQGKTIQERNDIQ